MMCCWLLQFLLSESDHGGKLRQTRRLLRHLCQQARPRYMDSANHQGHPIRGEWKGFPYSQRYTLLFSLGAFSSFFPSCFRWET